MCGMQKNRVAHMEPPGNLRLLQAVLLVYDWKISRTVTENPGRTSPPSRTPSRPILRTGWPEMYTSTKFQFVRSRGVSLSLREPRPAPENLSKLLEVQERDSGKVRRTNYLRCHTIRSEIEPKLDRDAQMWS